MVTLGVSRARDMHVLSTDVAIIGGGAAGCYAALNLHRRGIKPLIICKGLVGKSGASLFAGNLVISGRALGNSEAQARNTAEFLIKYHNQFLIDQKWARRCGEWIEKVYYPELEEAGPLFSARRRRQRRHQPGQDPQHRRQRSGQFRRAVHGPATQADHAGRHPAARGNRRHRAAAQRGRSASAACSASTIMTGEYFRRASARGRARYRLFRPPAQAINRHARDVGRRHRHGLARGRNVGEHGDAVVAHQ